MLSKVFTSSTVPEYQDCLTTCLRAWDLDKHPKVTISFSDNVVHRPPHVTGWFTEANPSPGFNRDINRIVNQNDSNTVYIIQEIDQRRFENKILSLSHKRLLSHQAGKEYAE